MDSLDFNTDQPAYKSLRDIVAERTSSLVAWIGSGLSAPAKLPTWPQLYQRLCEALRANIAATSGDTSAAVRRLGNIEGEKNYWIAFQMLQETMGDTSYKQTIRSALRMADTAAVPTAYKLLWKMHLSGVLNLNIDRLASRAHSEVLSGKQLFEFDGRSTPNHFHLLKSPFPFIANLHGRVEDASSWVLTQNDMQTLLKNTGYIRFVQTCLASRTVLFIGMSADDIMAGGHLAALTSEGYDLGSHYWVTNRGDEVTRKWAEQAGIQIITYSNIDGNHAQLHQFLESLLEYSPFDRNAEPVKLEDRVSPVGDLPSPQDLVKMQAEEIRVLLNAKATTILSSDTADKYERYAAFCSTYEEAIYRAWFVSTNAPNNKILGYTLLSRVTAGAFGTVYTANDKDGNTLAVKVLHEGIRNEPAMLQGFRRGVASMKILSQHKMPGVVKYYNASEIPAFAVMEYVDGPSLQEAIDNRKIKTWTLVLAIAVDLAKVIHSSHQLVERVLHRDIRPSNIMLRNGWLSEDQWKLVVLDFDLSWNREAREVSVAMPGTINGYLAPEQIQRSSQQSTRNALVDSYGLGMTLYFLRTGTAPQFLQPQHSDWAEILQRAASENKCVEWSSVPTRFFRLVHYATCVKQVERWDMSQIVGELERLQGAVSNPATVVSAELIAEELAARSFSNHYAWDANACSATMKLPTGLTVSIRGDEVKRRIFLDAVWQQMGNTHYAKIRKWLKDAYDKSRATLSKAGWHVDGIVADAASFSIGGNLDVDYCRNSLDATAASVMEVISIISFD